mmetsp:Transcript_29112/g.54506  ORF Transcript_29112/g.54506 Transcript_29112/m.54506 type:complete len:161 (-) Transcript_29112:205-687(-)
MADRKDDKVDKSVLVTRRSMLEGSFPIEIGPNTILHPECRIHAHKGPIKIGSNNLFEEQSVIVNNTDQTMVIGDYNLVEVGARIKAISIGSRNVFECKSSVALGAAVGNDCVIGAAVTICSGDKVEDNTVVYGKDRVDARSCTFLRNFLTFTCVIRRGGQ